MDDEKYIAKASEYLRNICSVKPNRRTGSKGNNDAVVYFAEIMKKFGYAVDAEPFDSLDYKMERVYMPVRIP